MSASNLAHVPWKLRPPSEHSGSTQRTGSCPRRGCARVVQQSCSCWCETKIAGLIGSCPSPGLHAPSNPTWNMHDQPQPSSFTIPSGRRVGVGVGSVVVWLIWSMARLSLSSCRLGQRWMPCLRQARCMARRFQTCKGEGHGRGLQHVHWQKGPPATERLGLMIHQSSSTSSLEATRPTSMPARQHTQHQVLVHGASPTDRMTGREGIISACRATMILFGEQDSSRPMTSCPDPGMPRS